MLASVNVQLKPSRRLLLLLLAITSLAMACVCASGLPPALQLLAGVFVGGVSALALRRHYFLQADDAIKALSYRHEQWYLQLRDTEMAAELLPTSTLTNSLLVLNFRLEDTGKKASLVLLPDSATADSLRQLKAVLRFGPNPHRNNSVA